VTAKQVLEFLVKYDYDLFYDLWNENPFYNGGQSKRMSNIDQLFGSRRFKVVSNLEIITDAAKVILNNPISLESYNFETFLEKANDVIAIKKDISKKMKEYWKVSL
jgi:hypothetical protein